MNPEIVKAEFDARLYEAVDLAIAHRGRKGVYEGHRLLTKARDDVARYVQYGVDWAHEMLDYAERRLRAYRVSFELEYLNPDAV